MMYISMKNDLYLEALARSYKKEQLHWMASV